MWSFFGQGHAQFVGNRIEDFVSRERGVGQISGFDIFRKPFEQHAAEHGLAAADFAADLDDAFVVGNGVDQCVQRRTTIAAGKEKLRMRRNAERGFTQTEVVEVHHGSRELAFVERFEEDDSMRLYRVVRLTPSKRAA